MLTLGQMVIGTKPKGGKGFRVTFGPPPKPSKKEKKMPVVRTVGKLGIKKLPEKPKVVEKVPVKVVKPKVTKKVEKPKVVERPVAPVITIKTMYPGLREVKMLIVEKYSGFSAFSLSKIPKWVWIATAGAIIFLMLKKPSIKKLISRAKEYEKRALEAKKKAEALKEYAHHLERLKELKAKI